MTTFLIVVTLLVALGGAIMLAIASANKSAEDNRAQWDVNYDQALFGPIGNVKQLTEEQVKNLRIRSGMRRLMEDIHAAQAADPGDEQPEDAYSKKLRLNAEHEAELATRKALTPEQRLAHGAAASKHYWANREAILQRKKDERKAAAIAAGRKPRVHATYLKQDDNPYPVHSPEYQKFAAEKRQRFHEQKHAVAALTPAPAATPAPALPYGREPLHYTYGQRALA